MYKEPTAGGVCVISTDIPMEYAYLKIEYPGELIIDRVKHHKGEFYPSYRIKNVPPYSNGQPVWINGFFLDFIRHQ